MASAACNNCTAPVQSKVLKLPSHPRWDVPQLSLRPVPWLLLQLQRSTLHGDPPMPPAQRYYWCGLPP